MDTNDTSTATLPQRLARRLGRSRGAGSSRGDEVDVDALDRLVQRIVGHCDWLARDLRYLLAGHEDLPLRYVAEPARAQLRRAFGALWASDLRRKGDQMATYNLSILGKDTLRTYVVMTQRDDTRVYDSAGNLVAAPASDRARRRRWEFRLTFDHPPEHIVEMSVREVLADTR